MLFSFVNLLYLGAPAFIWCSYRSTFKKSSVPVYGPWYLPTFVRGIIAMIRLGQDEDEFLLSVRKVYGPVVYLPWPLDQIFVLEGQAIQNVYNSPASTLSFVPIRISMQGTVFGSPTNVIHHSALKDRIFPVHARGLANVRLDAPIERFVQVVQQRISDLGYRVDHCDGCFQMPLVSWVTQTMFEAANIALFGEEFNARMVATGSRDHFNAFDNCFPLLVSELIPDFLFSLVPPLRSGIRGRQATMKLLADWVADGMPGLEEGVIKDTADIGLSAGFSFMEIGSLLNSDLWALQANAPYAAASFLLYIIQSPLLPAVQKELDSLPRDGVSENPLVTMKTLASMPLVTSCMHETLRLCTSSFSIRIVEESFVLSTPSSHDQYPQGYLIPGGSRIICATRAAHLTDPIWGPDPATWDGERFLDSKSDAETGGNKLSREVRGFGGGVSIASVSPCFPVHISDDESTVRRTSSCISRTQMPTRTDALEL